MELPYDHVIYLLEYHKIYRSTDAQDLEGMMEPLAATECLKEMKDAEIDVYSITTGWEFSFYLQEITIFYKSYSHIFFNFDVLDLCI